jgi:hypothetical protein
MALKGNPMQRLKALLQGDPPKGLLAQLKRLANLPESPSELTTKRAADLFPGRDFAALKVVVDQLLERKSLAKSNAGLAKVLLQASDNWAPKIWVGWVKPATQTSHKRSHTLVTEDSDASDLEQSLSAESDETLGAEDAPSTLDAHVRNIISALPLDARTKVEAGLIANELTSWETL